MMHGLPTLFIIFYLKFFEDYARTAVAAVENNHIESNMSLHPYFDFDVPRNVTARVGQTAFLRCRVEQLGDKSVSWIRARDLHILTAGVLTYTSDERFQVIRSEDSENWTLQIKFSQARDGGIYECQVNSEPKMSMAFRLNIVEAKAVVVGPTDIYVKMGSEVVLTCIVSQGPHELGTIYWYRDSTMLDVPAEFESNDVDYSPRITVDTKWTDALRSRLKISAAKVTDSGNYTCFPTAAEAASVTVHIINGEHPEAIQRGCANANIDMSIVFYIVTLSMVLQQLNRITHGYGVSYDVIRWLKSITPNTIACKHQYQNLPDCSSFNASDQYIVIGMEQIRLPSTATRLSSTVS
ncbi:uncharacterized protein LOC116340999 [Contarinia nasturtii]|uniref:uncharacterized protein LOC116340999 n=1 Tax=Contarinia nasturtii TaxID=265458 RepID=UPI0012D4257C|nr:uncharacterized protein LOC116340999 [Contarinia nasturtii]XP_031623672.1 uncharacterized protein LOC116340999 [Contarinia nasturtii]XP_031623673.1 uncharacterized protein LOC116340999 [Contarinia nasturtii]XP_031623675.1 uncharacterized protein LOC116340999 [Contarinia nasturtii]